MGNSVPCNVDYSEAGSSFNQTSSMINIGKMVDSKINSSEILMVSKRTCPACKRAKQLFTELYQELGVWPTIVELDQYDRPTMGKIVDYLQTKTGIRTVPQIFFQGTFVGGNDDVQRLRKQRALIKKYNTSKGKNVGLANNNIIRLSPVFNYTMPKRIRTQPVLLQPTQIKQYMANTGFNSVPVMRDTMSSFSLSPPSVVVPQQSQVFATNIRPRPIQRQRTAPVHEEKEQTVSLNSRTMWSPTIRTPTIRTPTIRTRHTRSMSTPLPMYNSRYNFGNSTPTSEYKAVTRADSIRTTVEPYRGRRHSPPMHPVLQNALSAPVVEEVIELPPVSEEVYLAAPTGDDGEIWEYSSSSETVDEFDNPNTNTQFGEEVEEIIDENVKFTQGF